MPMVKFLDNLTPHKINWKVKKPDIRCMAVGWLSENGYRSLQYLFMCMWSVRRMIYVTMINRRRTMSDIIGLYVFVFVGVLNWVIFLRYFSLPRYTTDNWYRANCLTKMVFG